MTPILDLRTTSRKFVAHLPMEAEQTPRVTFKQFRLRQASTLLHYARGTDQGVSKAAKLLELEVRLARSA